MDNRTFTISTICENGLVKKSNQDNILVKIGMHGKSEFGLFVVADGLGGLSYGEVASSIIIIELINWWDRELSRFVYSDHVNAEQISMSLDTVINYINNCIYKFGTDSDKNIGSTMTLLFVFDQHYIIKSIGDSRIYTMHQNTLIQLTEDHSFVAEEVRKGNIHPMDAKFHPRRNVLTRCLGIGSTIELFKSFNTMAKGQIFLLCSDGFHNLLEDHEIVEQLTMYMNKNEDELKPLIAYFSEIILSRGAHDNFSAIIVFQKHT